MKSDNIKHKCEEERHGFVECFENFGKLLNIVSSMDVDEAKSSVSNPRVPPQYIGKSLWLLVQGCTEPPENVQYARRKAPSGYLGGMKHDIVLMKSLIEKEERFHLYNSLENMRSLTKRAVLEEIQAMSNYAYEKGYYEVVIYYTGHGETGTGDWCFSDGTLSLETLIGCTVKFKWVTFISDCCYSGNLALSLEKHFNHCDVQEIKVLTACFPGTLADDTPEGGRFTRFYAKYQEERNLGDESLFWCKALMSYAVLSPDVDGNEEDEWGEVELKYMDRNRVCASSSKTLKNPNVQLPE